MEQAETKNLNTSDERVIAVAQPGRMGDTLYALPATRYLCSIYKTQADFYTSAYCAPLVRLLQAQSYIRNVIIPEDYVIENGYCGIQPWKMPIPEQEYRAVFQFGFRDVPDKSLPDYIAEQAGAPSGLPIAYEYPDAPVIDEPYIVIAPGADKRFRTLFLEIIKRSPIKSVIIGARDEYPGIGIDATSLDPLASLPWIAKSSGFVGLMSSPLVLANGFPVQKVIVHDGEQFDMRHIVRNPLNLYLPNPNVQQVLIGLGLITYSKTLHPKDYLWLGEAMHIQQMPARLKEAPIRYEHTHRAWEYGLVLKALREVGARSILDVGGGGSLFAPSAAWFGMEVTQVDPSDCKAWVEAQVAELKLPMRYYVNDFLEFESRERFDAVTCLSVLEHVEKDKEFFAKLLRFVKPGGLLCFTTDFHPSGEKMTEGHLRTYGPKQIFELADLARVQGFEFFGPRPSYLTPGPYVNDYNFASLIMQKSTNEE